MCEFWSAIITKKGKVYWNKTNSSHENLIKNAGLKDNNLEDRSFVRIEITPKNIFSKNKKNWTLKIDEPNTLPEWYTNNTRFYEDILWEEWEKAMQKTLWRLDLDAVEQVIEKIKEIKYFQPDGKPLESWHVSTGKTWEEAREAAEKTSEEDALNTIGNAARRAAGDTAGDAARDVAWDAAWDAAGRAAGDAAGDAARDAAWGAAWDATGDAALLARVKLSKIKGKHLKHVEEHMQVWKKGYALYCDINGKLYVYAKQKKSMKKKGEKRCVNFGVQ